jgi:acylphosphatase
MIENVKTYRIVSSGRVQGVGFRFYVESIAGEYGINGYVRNIANGRVETVCQGEEKSLNKFIERLKKGPSFSLVTDTRIEEINDSKKYSTFEIRY